MHFSNLAFTSILMLVFALKLICMRQRVASRVFSHIPYQCQCMHMNDNGLGMLEGGKAHLTLNTDVSDGALLYFEVARSASLVKAKRLKLIF